MFQNNNPSKSTQKKQLERNSIGKNTTIVGDVQSEGDFRIDGVLEGNLRTDGRVVVGETGTVKGTVHCVNADIAGKYVGELEVANTLTVHSTANIAGTVFIGKLSVEPGAIFNATCSMKGTVKELNQYETTQASEKAIS